MKVEKTAQEYTFSAITHLKAEIQNQNKEQFSYIKHLLRIITIAYLLLSHFG